ncbi:MAG: cation-binding protein [Candidatus Lokiarchaeota archaeon]|nr:cation-binding protein [Candidatus Lokiarchaeota archaeon]MBD3201521.1 cation-binding protein [Candidatus Lokiarchaeota archaeon]
MMPIGPLMKEHRLIEKVIAVMREEAEKIQVYNKVDPIVIETIVDFIRMYADRTHHGKEEDILFRDLNNKELSSEHKNTMEELVQEHVWARETTGSLVEAKEDYESGNKGALDKMVALLNKLTEFYPKHIKKEDKDFFIPVMDYFSEEAQDKMLDEFWDFDKQLIHEKYEKVYENLKRKV